MNVNIRCLSKVNCWKVKSIHREKDLKRKMEKIIDLLRNRLLMKPKPFSNIYDEMKNSTKVAIIANDKGYLLPLSAFNCFGENVVVSSKMKKREVGERSFYQVFAPNLFILFYFPFII